MNCVDARQLFSPWLDGELDEASAVALRLHLEGCGECSRELALWEDMSQALRQARPDVVAPSGFAEGVMARLRDESGGWGASQDCGEAGNMEPLERGPGGSSSCGGALFWLVGS